MIDALPSSPVADPQRSGGAIAAMPHDLLWIGERAGLLVDEPLPSWAGDAWIMAAPAVVRREHVATPGLIPVGLRGRTRSERCKAYLRESSVVRRVRPEELVQADFASMYAFLLAFPAVMELGRVAPLLDATGLPWGPTGSVGFALATGLPVLRQASDLDLVVRAAKPLGEKQLSALLALAGLVQCRIDIQIETPFGAFALAEFAAGRTAILLKTDMGPRLTDDPWRPAADGGAAMRKAP